MPVYEFRCLNCQRRFEIFVSYKDYDPSKIVCPHCKSANVQRRIGRLRVARSEESRMENLGDPSNLAGLENDPKALGRMMRQMSGEVGDDMPPEFDEVVHRLESGQSPEDIEKAMPDLGSDMGGEGMGGMGNDLDGGLDDL